MTMMMNGVCYFPEGSPLLYPKIGLYVIYIFHTNHILHQDYNNIQ